MAGNPYPLKLTSKGVFRYFSSIMLCVALAQPGWTETTLPAGITDQSSLTAAIEKLHGCGEAKYAALFKLIDYAAPELFRTPSIFVFNQHPDWINRAVAAIGRLSNDDQTLAYCIDHGTYEAKQWAIAYCGGKKNLIPHLRAAALNDPDSLIRKKALEKLPPDEAAKVLAELKSHRQTDPYLLEELFPNEAEFNEKLVDLLQDKDPKVRAQCLTLIGSDGQMGITPRQNHSFNGEVFKEIIKLTASQNPSERSGAAYALTRMRFYDPAAVKEIFLRLSLDKNADIRWRSAFGLVEQRGDKEVDQMFASLLKDPSPEVRYMTIVSLPDKSLYSKELTELSAVAQKLTGTGTMEVNSAGATAWVSPTPPLHQFLLADIPGRRETKHTLQELIDDRWGVIRTYTNAMRADKQESKAKELSQKLDQYLLLNRDTLQRSAANQNAIYVVSAYCQDGPGSRDRHKPYERNVHLCNTGAAVTLALCSGDYAGTNWHVAIDEGVNLQTIILGTIGPGPTSVGGNYPKSTKIIDKEPNGNSIQYCASDRLDKEETRARISTFVFNHHLPELQTVQVQSTPARESQQPLPEIVVGPADTQWRQTLTFNQLGPLYSEAIKVKNEKFRTTFGATFPMLIGLRSEPNCHPDFYLNPGWCTHLQAALVHKMPGPKASVDRRYDRMAFNPELQQYYMNADYKKVLRVDSQGEVKDISPPASVTATEKPQFGGLAYDTRRNRLLLSSSGIVLAYQPDSENWTKLSWKEPNIDIACYSADDDNIYGHGGDVIYRVDPETGALLGEGKLPLAEEMLYKQISTTGHFLITVSEMYDVPGGAQQLITVIDKRDGTILYQDVCNFVARK